MQFIVLRTKGNLSISPLPLRNNIYRGNIVHFELHQSAYTVTALCFLLFLCQIDGPLNLKITMRA